MRKQRTILEHDDNKTQRNLANRHKHVFHFALCGGSRAPKDTWEKSLTLPPLTSFANGQLTLDPKPTDKVTIFATPKAILKLKTNVPCS